MTTKILVIYHYALIFYCVLVRCHAGNIFNSFILLIVQSLAQNCLFAVKFPNKNIQVFREVENSPVLLLICCLTTRMERYETDVQEHIVLSSLCMSAFHMCKVRSMCLLTAGLFIQKFEVFVLVVPLKETDKVVLFVLPVMQFHFYMSWFVSSVEIAWYI